MLRIPFAHLITISGFGFGAGGVYFWEARSRLRSRQVVLAYISVAATYGFSEIERFLSIRIMHSRKRLASNIFLALIIGCAIFITFITSWGQNPGPTGVSLATRERIKKPGWWPTKPGPPRSEYAGSEACGECHSLKLRSQKSTPMARAAVPVGEAEILHAHSPLHFRAGSYSFEISQADGGTSYRVSRDTGSLSQPLQWAFGTGQVGQTYVFVKQGTFYETLVSYYSGLHALDVTMGDYLPKVDDLAEVAGRVLTVPETARCFGCHTTASSAGGQFDSSQLIPGVTCEACHGPGLKHIAAMRHGQSRPGREEIFNPATLNPVDSVDFCGACHRTAWDVVLSNNLGINNVRFQPYRLENSRCWGNGNARLTCITCHDPHQPLVKDASAYDNHCLACHATSSTSAKTNVRALDATPGAPAGSGDHPGICPVGTTKCVTCHMAKYEIQGSHAHFTDHWIRVVRADEPYHD